MSNTDFIAADTFCEIEFTSIYGEKRLLQVFLEWNRIKLVYVGTELRPIDKYGHFKTNGGCPTWKGTDSSLKNLCWNFQTYIDCNPLNEEPRVPNIVSVTEWDNDYHSDSKRDSFFCKKGILEALNSNRYRPSSAYAYHWELNGYKISIENLKILAENGILFTKKITASIGHREVPENIL